MGHKNYDISNCEREPIHIPGTIQPHGVLLTIRLDDLTIVGCSTNTIDHLGKTPDEIIDAPLHAVLGQTAEDAVRASLHIPSISDVNPLRITIAAADGTRTFDVILHMSGGFLVVELEPTKAEADHVGFVGLYQRVRKSMTGLYDTRNAENLCAFAATEIRRLTGFDRVMIYKFDAEWNGSVIAEDKRGDLAPYMGLHYPASDIPRQARELYERNWIRLIADVQYTPAELVAKAGYDDKPLDLTYSTLRSVSPVHREYLRNMGVASSMSVSIMRNGKLWGLVACHHATPKYVRYEVRAACELIAQVLSGQLELAEQSMEFQYAAERQAICAEIIGKLTSDNSWINVLRQQEHSILALVNATGAALCLGKRVTVFGAAPTVTEIDGLIEWLRAIHTGDIFTSDRLSNVYPAADTFKDRGSGMLALTVSREQRGYILWFRPEVVATVNWAGDPSRPVEDALQLHPRRSFELWKETVRLRSAPWKQSEIDAAAELRNSLVAASLRHAVEELKRSNAELDAFAYVASHDLRAPLRGLGHIAEWIEEDLTPSEIAKISEHLAKLRSRVKQMDALVAGLLQYARVGRDEAQTESVDVGQLVTSVIELLAPPAGLQFEVAPGMPVLKTKRLRLQQVFQNLIGNAIKHHDRNTGRISITVSEAPSKKEGLFEFSVADDGPGIDPKYLDKIFGLFQTLGTHERAENTGIGLALVKRVIENEGGAIRVFSEGRGTTFTFTWPQSITQFPQFLPSAMEK